jgi:hypothetical protein
MKRLWMLVLGVLLGEGSARIQRPDPERLGEAPWKISIRRPHSRAG